jgi:glycosyltransferase involved in cell wall biosynthesis
VKILMLSDYFHPHLGGVEEAVRMVSRRLVDRGHEVHVIALNTDGVADREVLDGIVVHRAPTVELTRWLGLQCALPVGAPPLLLRLAREVEPDLIHTHNLFFSTSLLAVGLKQVVRRPLVTTLQLGAMDRVGGLSRLLVDRYERTAGRLILAASDRVIAVSHAVAEHGRRLGCRPDRIRVVPNGVDLERYRADGAPAAPGPRRRIAVVGRLIFNKGPQYLVEAAPKILARHPDVEFVMVGDGPLRESLERTIAKRGLGHAFTFLGLRRDVGAILSTCALLVRPSLTEGLPLAVLEAMACGLPVVATPVGGTAEVVEHGRTGYLVQPGVVDGCGGRAGRGRVEPARRSSAGGRLRAGRARAGRARVRLGSDRRADARCLPRAGRCSARQAGRGAGRGRAPIARRTSSPAGRSVLSEFKKC